MIANPKYPKFYNGGVHRGGSKIIEKRGRASKQKLSKNVKSVYNF